MRTFDVVFISVNPKERFTITIDESLSPDQIKVLLNEEVTKRGYNLSVGVISTSVKLKNGEFVHIEEADLTSDEIDYIIHSCFVHMDNAFGFAGVEDIAFVFRTREQNHRSYPHVHAFHDDREISINLRNGKVEGHFKNSRKERTAVKCVKENLKYFLEGWRLLIDEGKTSSLDMLKRENGE